MPPQRLPARLLSLLLALLAAASAAAAEVKVARYPVPAGAHPHDVAPAREPGGPVWYTAQAQGALGLLDPATGKTRQIPLGRGSSPHGVVVGPDGAPWITDSGLDAIVRVDPKTFEVRRYPLPPGRGNANLNTAAFDGNGILWFTGQSGIYGRLDPATGEVRVFAAPRGPGPYGITRTPAGDIFYASLAGSHIARIDLATGAAHPIEPPTPRQGARRVWADSNGRIWVSEWFAGELARYDPKTHAWRAWKLPGGEPRPYAVYVDERDDVWVSDFAANAVLRFDASSERFQSFPLGGAEAEIRQMAGRPGEVWGAESATDHLVVFRREP